MTVVIFGSRTIRDMQTLKDAIAESGFEISEVVWGGAKGIDRLGLQWAQGNKIPTKLFQADWFGHGKAAGHIRNKQMAEYVVSKGGSAIGIWDGESKGTKGMIELCKRMGIPLHLKVVSLPPVEIPVRRIGILKRSEE